MIYVIHAPVWCKYSRTTDLMIGMVTTDKAKAEKWAADMNIELIERRREKDYPVHDWEVTECKDGEERPLG